VRLVIFCHSLVSDWNHGNAHFLRGVATELLERGHTVRVLEPADAWSVQNLLLEAGPDALAGFARAYPQLRSERYEPSTLDLDDALGDADVVIVHEWNDPALVARIGQARRQGGAFRLFFHDTHHRAATAPDEMARYDLRDYDGVLAFGAVIRDIYLERGWAQRAWVWHEAADARVFRPLPGPEQGPAGDVVWIGNWGDDERSRELAGFLLEPARALRLRAAVHGVRYPEHALEALRSAGIAYRGWLPNYEVPAAFARYRATVHVPRGPYAAMLPGIPTIRPFEALACGIPLVSAPWQDTEQLFSEGSDYLLAADGNAMRQHLRDVLNDTDLAASLAAAGLRTVLARHTCAHRVDELLQIVADIGGVADARLLTTTAS
jgi:spore maturation protein CgeB